MKPFEEFRIKNKGLCEGRNSYMELADFLALSATSEEDAYRQIVELVGDDEPKQDTPPPPPKPKPAKVNSVKSEHSGDAIEILAKALTPHLNIPVPDAEIDEGRVIELIRMYAPVKQIDVVVGDVKTEVSGVQHKEFEDVLKRVAAGMQMYLVGDMGTGKTRMAENIAEALGLPFYSISVCAQTSEVKFFGYMDATGNYVRTLFREAYENGGVFLVDEIDNGNANVLAALNASLAGNICAFPDGMVKRHKDFRCIAAANTFGMGASAQFVGRCKLDESTLDRFQHREIGYDTDLETALFGGELVKRIVSIREKYKNERVSISMRAYERVLKLMSIGLSMDEAIDEGIISNIPHNLRKK